MSDYEGMKKRLRAAVWEASKEAIDKVLEEAWKDGFQHGLDERLYKSQKEAEHELSGMGKR